jgi:hypothetical protein
VSGIASTPPGGVSGLPVTGSRLGLLGGMALALLLVGGLLVAGARRRTTLVRPGSGEASHRR